MAVGGAANSPGVAVGVMRRQGATRVGVEECDEEDEDDERDDEDELWLDDPPPKLLWPERPPLCCAEARVAKRQRANATDDDQRMNA